MEPHFTQIFVGHFRLRTSPPQAFGPICGAKENKMNRVRDLIDMGHFKRISVALLSLASDGMFYQYYILASRCIEASSFLLKYPSTIQQYKRH